MMQWIGPGTCGSNRTDGGIREKRMSRNVGVGFFSSGFVILSLIILSLIISGCAGPKRIKPDKSLDQENVVMQGYDYSCGASALATLMTYYFNDPVSEEELLTDILAHIPEQMIKIRKKEGMSLLDLKKAALRRGYKAYGITLKKASLSKLSFPVLVYLRTRYSRHFAILKGLKENRVFLADPARGNIRLTMDTFLKEWKEKITLILFKPGFTPAKDEHFFSKGDARR